MIDRLPYRGPDKKGFREECKSVNQRQTSWFSRSVWLILQGHCVKPTVQFHLLQSSLLLSMLAILTRGDRIEGPSIKLASAGQSSFTPVPQK